MTLLELPPVPISRHADQLVFPEVHTQPLLTKPTKVDFFVRCSSLLDVYMKGEDGYHDTYRLPLQPIHTDICGDHGMLVVNLCSSSVGFLHQLSSVGPLSHIVAAMDVICRGTGPHPSISLLLNDACRLCDGTASLPIAALE
jgi:hypothetical protein